MSKFLPQNIQSIIVGGGVEEILGRDEVNGIKMYTRCEIDSDLTLHLKPKNDYIVNLVGYHLVCVNLQALAKGQEQDYLLATYPLFHLS